MALIMNCTDKKYFLAVYIKHATSTEVRIQRQSASEQQSRLNQIVRWKHEIKS